MGNENKATYTLQARWRDAYMTVACRPKTWAFWGGK